jgi:hypothetical protein
MSAIVIAGLVTLLVGLAGWAISTPLARGPAGPVPISCQTLIMRLSAESS